MRRDHDENGIIGTPQQHSSALLDQYQHRPPNKNKTIKSCFQSRTEKCFCEQHTSFIFLGAVLCPASICVLSCISLCLCLCVCMTKVSRFDGVGSTKHRQGGGFNKWFWLWSPNSSHWDQPHDQEVPRKRKTRNVRV